MMVLIEHINGSALTAPAHKAHEGEGAAARCRHEDGARRMVCETARACVRAKTGYQCNHCDQSQGSATMAS